VVVARQKVLALAAQDLIVRTLGCEAARNQSVDPSLRQMPPFTAPAKIRFTFEGSTAITSIAPET
jgi:hypothetical protein